MLKLQKHLFGYRLITYPWDGTPPLPRHKDYTPKKDERDFTEESVARAKRMIIDYGINNNFNWFVTFTFDDKKKIDAKRYRDAELKLKKAISNYKSRYDASVYYLIVPELHDSKDRIHFHAVMHLEVDPVWYYFDAVKLRDIYTLPYFRDNSGITTCSRITQWTYGAALYMIKYITKQTTDIGLPNYYTCSKGLKTSETVFMANTDSWMIASLAQYGLYPSFSQEFVNVYDLPSDTAGLNGVVDYVRQLCESKGLMIENDDNI